MAGDLDIMVIFLVWQQKEGNFKYFLEVPPIVLNAFGIYFCWSHLGLRKTRHMTATE